MIFCICSLLFATDRNRKQSNFTKRQSASACSIGGGKCSDSNKFGNDDCDLTILLLTYGELGSKDIYSYCVVPLMAVLEEGILLVTLDVVSVKQDTKNTERKLYGIQWNAILLYFSLFQLRVWYGMNGIVDGGYKEISYRDSEELKDLVVFFIVELLVSEVIFLLYLKKSRICAILVSIWEGYEIRFVGIDLTDNLYVVVFALRSLTAVWQTLRYHRAERNHRKYYT